MVFVETSMFTRQIVALVDDETYRDLQTQLAANPQIGSVIRGTGGLRKVRIAARGKGKRGGARVIYYWLADRDQIAMLLAYGKDEQDDLTSDQRAALRSIVELWRSK